MAALPTLLAGCTSAAPVTASPVEPPSPRPTPPATPEAVRPTPRPSRRPSPRPTSRVVVPPRPDRLVISALGLDEPVIGLGLAPDGTLEVPADADQVGWFSGGGRPGGPGPTVIVGHVDSRTGPAVFFRLTELRPGSLVEVDAGGRRTRYRVTVVGDVEKRRFPTEAVFGATPTDELRLITCTGYYDRGAGSHRENRVVSAVAIA